MSGINAVLYFAPPSISARGTGSRNIYSTVGLYMLAVAAHLSRDGFSARAIQGVMDRLHHDFWLAGVAIITSIGVDPVSSAAMGKLNLRLVAVEEFESDPAGVFIQAMATSSSCYFLNLATVIAEVDQAAQHSSHLITGTTKKVKTRKPTKKIARKDDLDNAFANHYRKITLRDER